MINTKEVSNWLNFVLTDAKVSSATLYRFDSDKNTELMICAGWVEGYDSHDESLYLSEDKKYCLCVGVKKNNPVEWDYNFLDFPIFKKSLDVDDVEQSVNKKENINELSKYLIKEYNRMVQCESEGDYIND